jgi:hypothetical protein
MRRIAALSLALTSALAIGAGQPPAKPQLPAGHPGAPVTVAWPTAKPADVASVDAIMAAMYASTAGAPGQKRDWDRYRSLFVPDARLIAARPGPEGAATAMYLNVTNYVDSNRNYFDKGGFMDKEVARKTETFGNMVHVWSTFESRHKADDPQPYARGINSVQLLKDGKRFWIVNLYWDLERDDSPIPAQYLPDATK